MIVFPLQSSSTTPTAVPNSPREGWVVPLAVDDDRLVSPAPALSPSISGWMICVRSSSNNRRHSSTV
jgi:hypothetical protein